jgi:glycosyltransferase involved in cell wall biosynthesis
MVKNLIMTDPIISVVLPVHNAGLYVRDSIKSVLNQTFSDFELIIINDGSTDCSEEVILDFTDKRIKYIKNEVNLKLIETLNLGLSIAKGKYICRIDSDDIMAPTRLEKQLFFLERNSNYILVGSFVKIIKDGIITNQILGYKRNHDDLAFEMCFHNPIIHPTVMFRYNKQIKNQFFFDPKFIHAEDYEFWTRLVKHGFFHNLEEPLTYYRIHKDQISTIYTEFQKKQMDTIRLAYFKKTYPSYTNQEINFILFETDLFDFDKKYKILLNFYFSKEITGEYKQREILKRIRNLFLNANQIPIKLFLEFRISSVYNKCKFNLKQKGALYTKLKFII